MSLYDGSKFQAQFVEIAGDGKKVFAFGCGENVCTGERFLSQFAVVDGKKVFAFGSQGCQPPLNPTQFASFDETCVDAEEYAAAAILLPTMVEADAYPPHGMSRLIQVRATAFLNCPEYDCKVAYLKYNEPGEITSTPCDSKEAIPSGRGVWFGCIGKIDIHVWINPTVSPVGDRIRYCLSGCIDDDPHGNGPHAPVFGHLETDPNCHFAAASLGSPVSMGEVLVRGCCEIECSDSALFSVALEFRSFCGGFRSAQFVEIAGDGKKVFAFADCNVPAQCEPNPQNCCTPLAGCNLTITVPNGIFAGTYTMVPHNHTPPFNPPLGWQMEPPLITPCGHPGLQFSFSVGCRPHPTDPTKTLFDVQFSGGGLDCHCSMLVPNEFEVDFPCFPLEVEGTVGPFDCSTNPDPPCDQMCLDAEDIIPFVLTL